jgi:hypothetical protein
MSTKSPKILPVCAGKRADFEVRGERALRRAVRKVREEHRRLGLPLIVWQDGRVARIPAKG